VSAQDAGSLPARLRIRLATAVDAPSIAMLSRDTVETGLGWSWTPARVGRAVADRDCLVIVAARGPLLAGFAILQAGDDHGHLALLAVRPTWRRRGVGRALVDWLVESAMCAGFAELRLELRTANDVGRRFYEALGFEALAVAPGYYRGQEDALRMTRRLRDPAIVAEAWTIPAAWRGAGGN